LRITVYGADFSYPGGGVYARGTYIYPFFERRQTRVSPLEAQRSAFLYRAPFLSPGEGGQAGYYETAALRFYREAFEEKARSMAAEVIPAPGLGAPLAVTRKGAAPGPAKNAGRIITLFAPGKASMSSAEFLEHYQKDIAALPVPGAESGVYLEKLNDDERQILTTLLPHAAALKRRLPELGNGELIERVKARSVEAIRRVLAACQDIQRRSGV
jgi:hypothetical protein